MADTDAVGLAIGIPGLLEGCIRYHRSIAQKLAACRGADAQLDRLLFKFDTDWASLERPFELVAKVQQELSADVREFMRRSLLELQNNLLQFAAKLSARFRKHGNNFVFAVAKILHDYVAEFDDWHDCFARRLCVVGLTVSLKSNPASEQALLRASLPAILMVDNTQQGHFDPFICNNVSPLSDEKFVAMWPLPQCSAAVAKLPSKIRVILEYRDCDADLVSQTRDDVQRVANMLQPRDPVKMGVLRCCGFFEDKSGPYSRWGLASRFPDGFESEPRSLRSLLCNKTGVLGPSHGLEERIRLTRSIASAVLYIHSADHVHKSIRPDNILIIDRDDAAEHAKFPHALGQAFLIGFNEMPNAGLQTHEFALTNVHDLYRHPSRQGLHLSQKYSMLHDVYSLGVVLLEIALWEPAVVFPTDLYPGYDGIPGEFAVGPSKGCKHNAKFWGILHEARIRTKDPQRIQQLYIELARTQVPKVLGRKFGKVIQACLTCLQGIDNLKEPRIDVDAVTAGVEYLKRVVEKLEGISL